MSYESINAQPCGHGNQILPRAMVIQRKTQRPVQFELTEPTRTAVSAWLEKSHLRGDQYLFPSRVRYRGLSGGHLHFADTEAIDDFGHLIRDGAYGVGEVSGF